MILKTGPQDIFDVEGRFIKSKPKSDISKIQKRNKRKNNYNN